VNPARQRALRWLRENTKLTPRDAEDLAATANLLLQRIPEDRKMTVGIAGPPGSGKSTLARLLCRLAREHDLAAACLSLDDYYLPRQQRRELGRAVHPLCGRRGAPGSHELDRLCADLDSIADGRGSGLETPVFDKGSDDRLPRKRWRRLEQNPRLLLLEGWCIGIPPQTAERLAEPVNQLEESADPQEVWRRWMHHAWREFHRAMKTRLDLLWYIRVPGWEYVIDWRWRQEKGLEQPRLTSRAEVAEFLGTFERIVRHAQTGCDRWADLLLSADSEHRLSYNQQSEKA
jgi:D-glycerate 3-kinase